jgi:hypothetical protein
MITIVKRRVGHLESYDERKLYASVYASCLSVRTPVGAAELTAERVCFDVLTWLKDKTEITSADIRRVAGEHLEAYHHDAAYFYKNHRYLM